MQQRQGPQDSVNRAAQISRAPHESRNRNVTTWKSPACWDVFMAELSHLPFWGYSFYIKLWNNSSKTGLNVGVRYKEKELHRQARPICKGCSN